MIVHHMDDVPFAQKLVVYFDALIEHFAVELHCKGGCLVGNFSSELADVQDQFQAELDGFLVELNSRFAVWIAQAQKSGSIDKTLDPMQLAEVIVMTWEGAVLRMKTTGKIWPLELFRDQYLNSIINI